MYCWRCGKELPNEAYVCTECGVIVGKEKKASSEPENPIAIVGFIFSFFIAIVGLICSIIGLTYASQRNGKGQALATAGLLISLVEIIVSIILSVVLSFV